jgi:hypothetical protein
LMSCSRVGSAGLWFNPNDLTNMPGGQRRIIHVRHPENSTKQNKVRRFYLLWEIDGPKRECQLSRRSERRSMSWSRFRNRKNLFSEALEIWFQKHDPRVRLGQCSRTVLYAPEQELANVD